MSYTLYSIYGYVLASGAAPPTSISLPSASLLGAGFLSFPSLFVGDPDLVTPDPSRNKGYYVPSGPFWQDTARTTPATTVGQTVKAWDDASGSGQHGLWVSGPDATLASGGGLNMPASSKFTFPASVAGTSWSFYIWSNAPSPAATNFLVGVLGGTGPQIAPMHTGAPDTTYFGTSSSNYQTILGDTGAEKLRGMAMTGATASAFVGGIQSQLNLNAVSVSGFSLNADVSYSTAHVVRFIVLRDVADSLATTNAYRRHISRLLSPVNTALPTKRVVVNVHYEGQTVPSIGGAFNNAMNSCRAKIPFAKFTHCFSPLYELRGASHATVAAGFAPLWHTGQDTWGMHIHWYYALPTAAGVTQQDHPTSSSATAPDGDGYNVLSIAYGLSDSTTMFNYGKTLLATYPYGTPKTFTAGQWITNSVVRQALAAAGFTHDVSALPPALATNPPLPVYLNSLIAAEWSTLTTASQPYTIATGSGNLRQLVANCGMAGYDSPANMRARLNAIPSGQIGVVSVHYEDAAALADLATALTGFESDCAGVTTIQYISAESA